MLNHNIIEMEDVSLIYSCGVRALKNINLQIKRGEFVFIVGPTGSGKSSLLKLIYLEEFPTKGKVIINGRDISNLKFVQIPYLRRGVGVVFQDFKLIPGKTVSENVAFALKVISAPIHDIHKQAMKVLNLVGLSHKAKMFPKDLSGGEKQRLSIARALVNNPPILLADELTGNLDPDTSWEIMHLLLKINLSGTTVIVATHNKNIVNALKQRVVAIVQGCIVSDIEKGQYQYES